MSPVVSSAGVMTLLGPKIVCRVLALSFLTEVIFAISESPQTAVGTSH